MNSRVTSHRELVAIRIIEGTIAGRLLSGKSIEGVGQVVIDALRASGYVVQHPDDSSRPPRFPPIGR